MLSNTAAPPPAPLAGVRIIVCRYLLLTGVTAHDLLAPQLLWLL